MKEKEVLQKIEQALRSGSETNLVEFKDARGGFPKSKTEKSLSAFGNKSGGIIVFGVVEDKSSKTLNVVGVEDISTLQEKLADLSANEMNVVLRLDYHLLPLADTQVLAVYVPECNNQFKPYHIKRLGFPKGAFVRDGNTNRQMTEDEVKNYVRNAQGDDFDMTCAEDATIDDLSHDKMISFLKKSAEKTLRDFDETDKYVGVLENIGIVRQCGDLIRPTIAGYLIFSKNKPQKKLQFSRYVVRCVRYKGSGVHTDIIDSLDVDGTLDEQIDGMQAFILRNIRKSAEIVGTKRVERYEYPEKAIREIVANAVIHRDYRITETYTQVNIFEDRIEIFNPGNLPPGVTIENIKHSQVSRNKVIAARLKELDYLEEYGRGIEIAFSEMKKWGLLEPLFKNTSNSFRVILPGAKLSGLNERQLRIWEYMLDQQRVNRKDVEVLLAGIPVETIKYDLRKMKDVGLIQQKGKSSNTYYEASF